MKSIKYPLFAAVVAFVVHWTSVGLAADYEEVTYDDLLNQLSRKKTQYQAVNNHPFDAIRFQAGLGLISSATTVKIDGKESTKYQNGFQLSLGIDLFSEYWTAEGAIRNFGTVSSGSESRSLREFDLKIVHRQSLDNDTWARYGGGIGTRYFRMSDDLKGLSVNESTPVMAVFGGIDTFFGKSFSLGIEAGIRSAMITRSVDKNSLDMLLKMDTYF